jgi:Acetyltransferase (GNAT) domain
MSVYELNPLTDPRWADLVARHPDASVFHAPAWLEALSSTYGYEPAALTTTAPAKPLQNGLVFCRVKSALTGSRLVSLPFSDHCQPLASGQGELLELLQGLRGMAEANSWKYLELRPVGELGAEVSSAAGLAESSAFWLHLLDLRPGEETLFRGFHKSCVQRKVQKSEKEGLICEEGRSERLLKMFYGLLLLTRRRHQLPPQPLVWFRNLLECFGEALTIRIALKDGQAVASMLTLLHNKTLTYKYGCSDANFHNLGGMPFLFWRAIRDAKKRGAEQFDFGRSETDNPGLITFKDHWGGRRSMLKYYRYPARPAEQGRPGWQVEAGRAAFSMLPDFCLVAAGRLLYKHFG